MKAKLISYCFNVSKPDEAIAYETLCANMKAAGVECFETWGRGSHYMPFAAGGVDIELDTKHLFSNQWNTAPVPGVSDLGLRVFDWAQDAFVSSNAASGAPSKSIKRGHYLEISEDTREIRRNTVTCGYCGKQEPAQKGYVFCPHCLDRVHLEEKDLFLLRMVPVKDTYKNGARPPLSEAEKSHLIPLYLEAQTKAQSQRSIAHAIKMREKVEKEYANALKNAETEYKGFMWLLDKGLPVENVIFYKRTNKFCFGWQKLITGALLDALKLAIADFPFDYEIKGD